MKNNIEKVKCIDSCLAGDFYEFALICVIVIDIVKIKKTVADSFHNPLPKFKKNRFRFAPALESPKMPLRIRKIQRSK